MKKTLSRTIPILIMLFLVLTLVACGTAQPAQSEGPNNQETQGTQETASEPITIKVGVPTAPPALPVLHMMETKALGENVNIELSIWDEPETLIAMVQDGEHALFAFPLTVVSKLYNKGLDVRLMNVNTWGVTYFLTSDPDLKEWQDLKGKTVYVPLQSSPPDALTQYFLHEAGLEAGKDLEIIYASTPEIATLLASGKAAYATLIEPQVTRALLANSDLRIAFSFEEEWQRVNATDTKIPNAGFGTTQKFIEAYPELTAQFQEAYAQSTQWANEHPEQMGELAEKYLGLKKELVAKALPSMGLTFQSAQDSQTELKMFYDLLWNFEPSMIGGKVADDGLYYGGK